MNEDMKKHFDWRLEKYLLNKADIYNQVGIGKLKQENNILDKKIENLEKKNEEFLKKYPLEMFLARINQRLELHGADKSDYQLQQKRGFLSKQILYPGFVLIIFFAVFLFIYNAELTVDYKNREIKKLTYKNDTTRDKGLRPFLIILKKNHDSSEELRNLSKVSKNDIIQLSYVSAKKNYGIIFSIDGNGKLTLHYPENKNGVARLKKKGVVPLSFAYKLDDAPGFERFFFISSDNKFSIERVLHSASKLTGDLHRARYEKLELPEDFKQNSILLIKK